MKQKFAEMSLEKLTKTRQMLKGIFMAYAIIGVIMITVMLIVKPKQGMIIPFVVLPLGMLPALLSFKLVTREIALRNGKQVDGN